MDDLLYDIKRYEILPRLDGPSENIIRHILLGNKLTLSKHDDSCVLSHVLGTSIHALMPPSMVTWKP